MTDNSGPAAASLESPSRPGTSMAPPAPAATSGTGTNGPRPAGGGRVGNPPVPIPMIILNILMSLTLLAILIWQQIVFSPLWSTIIGNDHECLIWCTVWVARYYCGASTETAYFICLRRGYRGVSLLRLIKTLLSVFSFAWWLYGIKPVLVDSIEDITVKHWSRGLWYAHLVLMLLPFVCACTVLTLYFCGFVSLMGPQEPPSPNQLPTPQEIIDLLTVKKFQDCHFPIASVVGSSPDVVPTPSSDPSSFSTIALNQTVNNVQAAPAPSALALAQMSTIISPMPISMNLQRGPSRPFGRSNTIRDKPACPVCFGEFEFDDDVVCMPCDERHIFHPDCIKNWLEKSQCCPICRSNIVELLGDKKSPKIDHGNIPKGSDSV